MTELAEASPPGVRPTYPFVVTSRDILGIALPTSIAFITEPLVGIVDITVIGRLGDAALLGGLVLGALAFDVIFSLAYFLRLGTAGLTAQAVGARDPRDGLMHLSRAIAVALILGILMIVFATPLLWLIAKILAPAPGVDTALATYFHVRIWSAPSLKTLSGGVQPATSSQIATADGSITWIISSVELKRRAIILA